MVVGKTQLRRQRGPRPQQQQRLRGRGRQNNRGNTTTVDARQNIRKGSSNNSIVVSKSNIRNDHVRLFTSHFDARHKIDQKKGNFSQTGSGPNRFKGVAKKALDDVRKNSNTGSAKINTKNANGRNWKTSNRNNNNNNNRSKRETTFTGKSIQIVTPNELAPKERKALMKGKSLSVTAKNKNNNNKSNNNNNNKALHKTINNTWIGPMRPTSPIPDQMTTAAKKSIPAKLVISNLHPNVTQDDILELFGAIGPLRDGRLKTIGTAEVIYKVAEDAFAAYSKYHGRNLDGQPMILKITTADEAASSSSQLSQRSNKPGFLSSPQPYYSTLSNSIQEVGSSTGPPVVFTVKL